MTSLQNFSEVNNEHTSIKSLEFCLDQFLGNGTQIKNLSRTEQIALFQELSSYVEKLWRNFNTHRSELSKYYLSEHSFLMAYMGSFYYSNVAKIYTIMANEEITKAIELILNEKKKTNNKTIHVVDYGAGPLTAIASTLLVFSQLDLDKDINIVVSAVERSEKAFATGKDMLDEALFFRKRVTYNLYSSIEKIPENGDLIIAANVINEIPKKHHTKTIEQLLSRLAPNGVALIIEPGQDAHAWNLAEARNQILAKPENGIDIIAPCCHKLTCPLSNAQLRKDWCWFSTTLNTPYFISMLDRYCGLNHKNINYTFLAFTKQKNEIKKENSGRIVSDPISINLDNNFNKFISWATINSINIPKGFFGTKNLNGSLYKTLLCSGNGNLESILTTTKPDYTRGSLILIDENVIRVKERSGKISAESEPAHIPKDTEAHS